MTASFNQMLPILDAPHFFLKKISLAKKGVKYALDCRVLSLPAKSVLYNVITISVVSVLAEWAGGARKIPDAKKIATDNFL